MFSLEKKYVFSSDVGDFSHSDIWEVCKLAQDFFLPLKKWDDEIKPNSEMKEFILKYKDLLNVISCEWEIVWYTCVLFSNKQIMDAFTQKEISELEIFSSIRDKEVNYSSFDAIYLCSAYIKDSHRSQWLALKGFLKTIKKLVKKTNKSKVYLFYRWFFESWAHLGKSLGDTLNMDVIERVDML